MGYVNISEFVGLTFQSVRQVSNREIVFTTNQGVVYTMNHAQDCCEDVYIEDVVGDLEDLVETPILIAHEDTNRNDPTSERPYESYTWTYYNISTVKGSVNIRWFGGSNGYYSESVDICKGGRYD